MRYSNFEGSDNYTAADIGCLMVQQTRGRTSPFRRSVGTNKVKGGVWWQVWPCRLGIYTEMLLAIKNEGLLCLREGARRWDWGGYSYKVEAQSNSPRWRPGLSDAWNKWDVADYRIDMLCGCFALGRGSSLRVIGGSSTRGMNGGWTKS